MSQDRLRLSLKLVFHVKMKFFTHKIKITKDAIDMNSHVNNVMYIQWMQDAATKHSLFVGDTPLFQKQTNIMWVVKNHNINYHKPAFENEEIEVVTWVESFRKAACFRKYEFKRNDDILAQASSLYVYLDKTTKRPKKITSEVFAFYSD